MEIAIALWSSSGALQRITEIGEESFGTVSERRGSRGKSCNYVSKHITYRITKKACMAELSGGAKRCCIF